MTRALAADILAAHAAVDKAQLVRLYTRAANKLEQRGDIGGTCFFLTQAYVFALETGHADTAKLHRRLVAFGHDS